MTLEDVKAHHDGDPNLMVDSFRVKTPEDWPTKERETVLFRVLNDPEQKPALLECAERIEARSLPYLLRELAADPANESLLRMLRDPEALARLRDFAEQLDAEAELAPQTELAGC